MKDVAENRMICEPYVGKFGQTYECSCGCHRPGVAMMHCAPCCYPCPVCSVFVRHSEDITQEHFERCHSEILKRVQPAVEAATARRLLAEKDVFQDSEYHRNRVRSQELYRVLQNRGTQKVRDSLREKAEEIVDGFSFITPVKHDESYYELVEDVIDQLVLKKHGQF